MKKAILILALLLLPSLAFAGHLHPEKWYQEKWCAEQGGQSEVVLADKTRADCITATHAVEVEFARKYLNAIGQAIHYSRLTGKKPAIVLILEKPGDRKYWIRLNSTIQHFNLPIDTWEVSP